MRGGARLARAALAGALGAAACSSGTLTLPEPPDAAGTTALVATYQMPTATLDPSTIDQVFSDAQSRLADLQADWLPDLVADALTAVRSRLDDGGLPTDPATTADSRRAQLTAVAAVNRICKGWDDPAGPPDQATNGSLDFTAIVDHGQLNPELWAVATGCRTRFPPAGSSTALSVVNPPVIQAIVDGTLIVYSLGPLPVTTDQAQLLVRFDGMITVSDQAKSLSFDFEISKGVVKFRLPVASGGDAIVTVGTTLGIQGANAGFSCDLTTLTCQSAS